MVGLRFATCHRILVPKSQVESIFQCFGLIFILMDPLGALLNTLGANLLKSVFLETPCIILPLHNMFRHSALVTCCLQLERLANISCYILLRDGLMMREWPTAVHCLESGCSGLYIPPLGSVYVFKRVLSISLTSSRQNCNLTKDFTFISSQHVSTSSALFTWWF